MADQNSQSWGRSTLDIHWKDLCWSSSILVIWCEQTTHWKSPWCWERLTAEGEEGIGEWDGWTASLMQWPWTWAKSRRRWGTGRPGVLQSMGSQRVGHEWATEQQHGKNPFSFLRNCQTAFHSGCTSLYFYQRWMRVPLGPHPYHHLVLSVVWILAILMCV